MEENKKGKQSAVSTDQIPKLSLDDDVGLAPPVEDIAQKEGLSSEKPGSEDNEKTGQSTSVKEESGSATPFGSPLKTITRSVETGIQLTSKIQWKVIKKTAYKNFVFDFDDGKFLFSGNKVLEAGNVQSYNKHFHYIVDFADAPALGMIIIAGDYKYSHVLARKELEDRGDLTTEGYLWIYKREKIDPTQTQIFYHIFPRQRYNSLVSLYKKHSSGFVLFDTIAVLYNILKTLDKSRIHALAMRVADSIILLVGNREEIYLVRRYGLVGRDDFSIGEALQSVAQDLVNLENRLAGETISQINWIETLTFDLNQSIPELPIPLYPWPVTELQMENRTCWSALPNIVNRLSLNYSIGPKEEKFLRPLEKIEPWIMTACLFLAIAFGSAWYLYNNASKTLKQNTNLLQNQIRQLQSEIASMKGVQKVADTAKFIKTASILEQACIMPRLGDVWNLLSSLRPRACRINGTDIKYSPDKVQISMSGVIEAGLGQAQGIFKDFIASLEKVGFKTISQQIHLDLEENTFSLSVEWPVKRGS
ncbi:hypothetical protein [Desulfovulcanus sp.]